jgi:hypothetical protein
MSLRILHILDHSLPLQSGYVYRTCAILRAQHAMGWDTAQLTTPRQGPCEALEERVDGWWFHRTPFGTKRASGIAAARLLGEMRATAARIDHLVSTWRPTVLHAHSPVLNALPAIWVGHKHRLPVVYEVRALWEDAAVDHGSTVEGSVRYRLSRALETFALRQAGGVATICEGLKRDIAARGIPENRITVVPNAVDTTSFRFDGTPDARLRAELGLSGRTVLGFVGSFYGYEGLDVLIDGLRYLLPRWPLLKVLLVGGGPQETALRERVRKAGLRDMVVFAGRVPHEQVQRYYDLIDLLVYPRRSMRLTELVTPLKPLEAMAQGRVLVASDVGGHRELIRDGDTGYLFQAGNVASLAATVQRALGSRSDWLGMRLAARRYVERERTWSRVAARYAGLYLPLLARSGLSTASTV